MSRITFRYSEEVYNFIDRNADAWAMPMVENYVEMAGLTSGEEFDVTELNRWLDDELASIKNGYEEFLDRS